MQVNNLPIEIQNKVFYFLEHPIASIIRGKTMYSWLEYITKEEDKRFSVEVSQIIAQLSYKLSFRHRSKFSLKVRLMTEEDTKELDPLFLHMNRAIIDFIIKHKVSIKVTQYTFG